MTAPAPEPTEWLPEGQPAAGVPADPATPWWVRRPERLEYEELLLREAGIPYRRDETAFGAGVARLIISPTVNGEQVDMLVTFPDLYPYFRFAVDAPRSLGLSHHQSGLGRGTLCLLQRATEYWRPSDTVAGLLQSQLSRVLSAGQSTDRDAVADIEAHQAEPFSEWYPYVPAMLQIDSAWQIPAEAREGTFSAAVWRGKTVNEGIPLLHGAVLEIRDQRKGVLATADPRVVGAYGPATFEGRWTRANSPIAESDPAALFAAAAGLESAGREPPWIDVGQGGALLRIQIRGVLFPEEHNWRDSSGQGWVFVVRGQSGQTSTAPVAQSKFMPAKKAPSAKTVWSDRYAITRAGRAGVTDLQRRIPELRAIAESRVAVVGLGCIGAPSAMEFARAQVAELRITDGDIVDPATVPRWPLGLSMAGQPKAAIIADWIKRDYPYTSVIAEGRTLGNPRLGPPSFLDPVDEQKPQALTKEQEEDDRLRKESDYVVLERLTRHASLVYDASAEVGVQYFLSEFARERGLPYIAVAGTLGGWGGRIVRVRPGVTQGCWVCVQTARADGSLPDPPANPNGELMTEGCADPTFTATNFDMTTIAMHGVRLAISTLAAGAAGGYPAADWDIAVIALRNDDGRLIAPTVQTFELSRHPDCPACAVRR